MANPLPATGRLGRACIMGGLLVLAGAVARGATAGPVQFNRDVRPIFSENCFECHGPGIGNPKAGLNLLERSDVIQPGDSSGSLLIQRVESPAVTRMPPPSTGKRLSEAQISVLRRWIDEGARLQRHWAFVQPQRPEVPGTESPVSHPVDGFVRARLESEGLEAAGPADPRTLVRRASLDLTGLPPSRAEVRGFLNDERPDAFDRLVDRLLASPHHGERMAQEWLDAARYADTTGFAADVPRPMWLFRDWVIEAFQTNMPFDRFTIEQLAGDLLPGATQSQRIATGFHRNSMQALGNNPPKEEFRIRGIVDRLDTTGRVWLGLTVACAECHDHKYDPISQREYYQLFAIFNNIPHYGQAFGIHGPRMLVNLDDAALPWGAGQGPDTDRATREAALAASGLLTAQVMLEMKTPRDTRIHVRGNFEEQGERVSPGVPEALGALEEGVSADRLGFARWLVNGRNPLVARVFVNRLWQQLFGTGLVRTVEDFGSQGEWPSHPELLDWLAVEFVESGWDIRYIVRLLVTSATYRQSSRVSEEVRGRDHYNRLLARGPRARLPAEQIRDSMLAVSGLLSRTVGGPSVYPDQPTHVGEFRDASAGKWTTSPGADRFRRGVYTFWQRMYPYPSMALFDAPSRERSCIRRTVSNTPLQALVLLNDPVIFEGARAFGGRILLESEQKSDPERIRFAFETALARPPDRTEADRFQAFVRQQRARFTAHPGTAESVVGGRSSWLASLPAVELATWTMVGSTMLALDETITRH